MYKKALPFQMATQQSVDSHVDAMSPAAATHYMFCSEERQSLDTLLILLVYKYLGSR